MEVSIVIATLNEEKHIGECLENVKFADDIIIMDSYSNDKTIDIAKKYTNKIYQVDKIGTGKIKNMGIEKAKNKWVINLDADERIPETLREEIEKVTFENLCLNFLYLTTRHKSMQARTRPSPPNLPAEYRKRQFLDGCRQIALVIRLIG